MGTLTSKGIGIGSNGVSNVDSGDEERTMLEEYSSLSKSFLPDDKVICSDKGKLNNLMGISFFTRGQQYYRVEMNQIWISYFSCLSGHCPCFLLFLFTLGLSLKPRKWIH